jgi:hypothetical protein
VSDQSPVTLIEADLRIPAYLPNPRAQICLAACEILAHLGVDKEFGKYRTFKRELGSRSACEALFQPILGDFSPDPTENVLIYS